MTDDLVKRLRTACSPVSPLGILCSEAADAFAESEARHACEIADIATRFRQVNVEKAVEQIGPEISDLRAKLSAAEAALKEAVELLRPFADEAAGYDPPEGDDGHNCYAVPSRLRIGHLRAARRFIEAHTGGEDANHG
jgi:hypothetical protein